MGKNYAQIAKQIRRQVVEMLYRAGTCHLGSDMSCVDILTVLYFGVMRGDDIFIMSKGHGAAALYATLAEKGIISKEDLLTYGQEGTKYLNLCNREVNGVYTSTGALGHGLPIAVGAAIASPHKKVYCLISDGELAIGTTWESALIASHHKLENLYAIVDDNKLQATGKTNEVLNSVFPYQVPSRWGAIEIDGHDHNQLRDAFTISDSYARPKLIVANTIKGKGISFAENNNDWHYNNLTKELYEKALSEL